MNDDIYFHHKTYSIPPQGVDYLVFSQGRSYPQSPLLPRSAWRNQQAFYQVLLRTKRLLDIAEMSAFLDGDRLR